MVEQMDDAQQVLTLVKMKVLMTAVSTGCMTAASMDKKSVHHEVAMLVY